MTITFIEKLPVMLHLFQEIDRVSKETKDSCQPRSLRSAYTLRVLGLGVWLSGRTCA
jgi:hypothetical protein